MNGIPVNEEQKESENMSKFERKFGKYAIPNLTLILIICYVVGYVAELLKPELIYTLALNPERILHGQVWRLLTWILIPPESLGIFTIIMLYFYYSIGTLMERTLGTYRYNVYIFGGILMTVVAAFLAYGLCYWKPELMGSMMTGIFSEDGQTILGSLQDAEQTAFLRKALPTVFLLYTPLFSTYYINIAIFLAFAACYPDMQVLLMFVVPVKVMWLGILDLAILGYTLLVGDILTKFAVAAALLNFFLFYAYYKNLGYLKPSQIKRRVKYQHKVQQAQALTKHKCAICGRTEETDPNMEFRYCSKCEGNYEYCSEHLYTHTHVKSGKN